MLRDRDGGWLDRHNLAQVSCCRPMPFLEVILKRAWAGLRALLIPTMLEQNA